MKKILLIHGPNLNRLGKRDPSHYGVKSLKELEDFVKAKAACEVLCFQSNHEGALIDFIQAECESASGILINPGALTHTSYALHDALVDSGLPCVEVHLSNVKDREAWRAVSVTLPACLTSFYGKQEASYKEGLDYLLKHL